MSQSAVPSDAPETPPVDPAGSAGGQGADPLAALRVALEAAQARADENHDQFLRARAEAENARRRAQDDVTKAHKYAVETFAEALVPVFDTPEQFAASLKKERELWAAFIRRNGIVQEQ